MSGFLDERYQHLRPYVPGEQPQGRRVVKLNTNEMPYPPSPLAQKAAAQEAAGLNLYPDPTGDAVARPLAAALSLVREQVFIANGSDEALAFCFQGLCPRGAAFADLTYGFYPVYAALYEKKAQVVPLRGDFTLCVEDYAACEGTVFIANPNAPTGLALPRAQIEALLLQNPRRLVVVDEAYVDFGAESAVPLLQRHHNLLVVGTFSKSRAMAGARLGFALGSRELIQDLERLRNSFNPYNVNRMTLAAGAAALADAEYFEECRKKIMQTRAAAITTLRGMGFEVTNSLANFVFARHAELPAQKLYEALKQSGVLVRWFNAPRIQNHLRISVGTEEEMGHLYATLRKILENPESTQ